MTEEMKNASREAPKAIVLSVFIGAITGFAFLVTISFCIGDFEATATSSTGVPVIQIFFDSTDSIAGACLLASLITVIVCVCALFLLAEGSRALYAFARDHGLPFSRLFVKVEPKRQVPVYSVLLTCGVQMALNSIYFGTPTGFNTVIAIATEGFCKYSPRVAPYLIYS
jgi:choline transport protein